jgi:hypothetical protein
MSNIEARLASALLLSVAASAGLIVGNSAVRAADSCITEPKTETPQSKHWYFRIERGTGRHCWYLRGEDEASARTPNAEPVAAAKPAPSTTGNAPARSLSDARAEFAKARADANGTAPPAPSVWPDPQSGVSAAAAPVAATTGIGPGAPAAPADSQLTSRWPQPSGAPATANATPQTSLMVAADAQPAEVPAATPAPAEAPQASTAPTREVGSLQKLALVALGALALAGITGSLVYRLAGTRWRRRRETLWPEPQLASPSLADEARGAPWVEPELSPAVSHVDDAHEDVAHEGAAADRIEFGKSDDSFEKIEDFLARLTKQLQDELQTPRSTEVENPHPH